MDGKLCKGIASTMAMAALLALGGCGDRSGESAAQRAARNETASEQAQNPTPSSDAAARSAAQRSGSAELAQGRGS